MGEKPARSVMVTRDGGQHAGTALRNGRARAEVELLARATMFQMGA